MTERITSCDTPYSKVDVEEFAREQREEFLRHGESLRKRLAAVVRELGGRIKYVDSAEQEETLRVNVNDEFKIFLPLDSSEERDNFTIAHELGHYFMHLPEHRTQTVTFGRRGSNRIEWEANWFAAEFLMPEDKVRRFVAKHDNSPYDLARVFGVSPMAARVRIESLGLD